jgi:hypothetical protein
MAFRVPVVEKEKEKPTALRPYPTSRQRLSSPPGKSQTARWTGTRGSYLDLSINVLQLETFETVTGSEVNYQYLRRRSRPGNPPLQAAPCFHYFRLQVLVLVV